MGIIGINWQKVLTSGNRTFE